jgi:hypothetical protein
MSSPIPSHTVRRLLLNLAVLVIALLAGALLVDLLIT